MVEREPCKCETGTSEKVKGISVAIDDECRGGEMKLSLGFAQVGMTLARVMGVQAQEDLNQVRARARAYETFDRVRRGRTQCSSRIIVDHRLFGIAFHTKSGELQ